MRLKDKVAIITGGAHGMGEAEARLFAIEGAKVIVADILGGDAEQVAADIRADGREAAAAKIDVTSEAEWRDLIAKAVARYGRLDILVNNAGISGSSVGDPDSIEGWHRIIAVNQTGVFLGTKLAAEQMVKTGGGSAINLVWQNGEELRRCILYRTLTPKLLRNLEQILHDKPVTSRYGDIRYDP